MVKKLLILGSGVVGEATGRVLAGHGFDVLFTDVGPGVVSRLREKGYNAFLTDEMERPEADIYMVSVPTYPYDLCKDEASMSSMQMPASPQEWCNLGVEFIKKAGDTLGKWLLGVDGYRVVVIRSAVLPGTTEETVIPRIEAASKKRAGKDFGVCVNPEYLRERESLSDIANPWITVIGEMDKRAGDWLLEVYKWAACPVYRVTIKEAEMQKFVHNLFNANKISYFNEMRLISRKIGVDFEKIVPIVLKSAEGIWNPEYGTKDMGPFGGKCLPKDTLAFIEWARLGGMQSRMIEATVEVNKVVEKQMLPVPG